MKLLLATLLLCLPLSSEVGWCFERPPILYHIARREGFYKKGTLPSRLHNPGSLKFQHQAGARRGPRGFAWFTNDERGWAELDRDVMYKIRNHIPLHRGWNYL